MDSIVDISRFETRLADRPEWKPSRAISLFAASVAWSDNQAIKRAINLARSLGVVRQQLYEAVLQSYLFLGFPRMLVAALVLDTSWPAENQQSKTAGAITSEESAAWFEDGLSLCRKIYGQAFGPLRERVERIAPEIFRWMIIEGYGKVLTRDGLDLIDRELCIVASLVIDNRPDQLHSHLKGAINAGATPALVRIIVDDLGEPAGSGYIAAVKLLEENGLAQ